MEVSRFCVLGLVVLLVSLPVISMKAEPAGTAGGLVPPTRDGPVSFTNVSAEVGLSDVRGNFFSWGDFDNDGHQDLLVDGKKLFRNTGPPDFHFADVTERSGIDRPVNSGVFADYDNDGWLDIFCGGGRGSSDHPELPDVLWHNDRDGTFSDATSSAGGLSDTFPTVAGGWADVDRNGYLDLYMVNYENGTYQGYPDNFWYNDGDGTFSNGTSSSGMDEYGSPLQGRGISFSDFDNDGFVDAYVSNYRIVPNYLYRNQRNGTMLESAAAFGVEGHGNDHPITQDGPYYGHSLGSSWGDLDNDGDMDLWVTNLAHKDAWRGPICDDSYLFENQGPEEGYSFIDVRDGSGIPIKQIPGGVLGDGDELMVSSALADHDNDGDLDLFIPQIYGDVSYAYSYFYSNDGDMTFTEVSSDVGIRVWNTYGSAWCDYNEDGWIDLVTGGGTWNGDLGQTTDHMVHLYRNDGASTNSENLWLEVDLVGRESNSDAIGARVKVEVDRDGDGSFDLSMIREVQGGTAAHGQQDSMVLHFGLGNPVEDIRVTTIWPMGREVVMDDVQPNTRLENFEPTEDIGLNLTITNFEPSGEGTEILLQVHDPSVYPISYIEFEVTVESLDGLDNYVIPHTERISPGNNDITLMTPGLQEDIVANVTVEVLRSFPPISSGTSDSIRYDPLSNILPVPILDGPSEVEVGDLFSVDASRSFDADGSISGYSFDMGDGTVSGWQDETIFSHSYTVAGDYDVRLSVKDDRGAVSLDDAIITIEAHGELATTPVAVIDYIRPDVVEEGERVRMKGHGTPSGDRTIEGYEWTSSIDGLLGDTSYLAVETLSPGVHEIQFAVLDSDGEWSEPAVGQVEITAVVIVELWVEIAPPAVSGPYSGKLELKGSSGPPDRVEMVEVRIDSGPWERTRTVPDWTFEIDCGELGIGSHRIDARSFGDGYYSSSYASFEFEVVEQITDDLVGTNTTGGGGMLGSIPNPVWIVFAAGGVVLIAAVVVVMLLLMSRKAPRSSSEMGASRSLTPEEPLKDPVSIVSEEDYGDIEVVEASVIE
ncbi:MAG: FG-GAP-like repeat-containing protein [Thermoplasmatota archaeon]